MEDFPSTFDLVLQFCISAPSLLRTMSTSSLRPLQYWALQKVQLGFSVAGVRTGCFGVKTFPPRSPLLTHLRWTASLSTCGALCRHFRFSGQPRGLQLQSFAGSSILEDTARKQSLLEGSAIFFWLRINNVQIKKKKLTIWKQSLFPPWSSCWRQTFRLFWDCQGNPRSVCLLVGEPVFPVYSINAPK